MASKTKLANELSAEKLEEFLARLRSEPKMTGKRLMELAAEIGIRIGHDSANTFLRREFEPYLLRIQHRSRLAQFISQESTGEESSKIADAAAGDLAQAVFEFCAATELDIDMASKEGMRTAKDLSLIIGRIRRGDHTQRALEAKLKEMHDEREAMKKTLEGEATRKGVSVAAQNEMRRTLGMDPLPVKEAA